MEQFMDKDFLLQSKTAKTLFHEHAEKMPLFDYHCHLTAKEIAENKSFESLGKLWLEHDHYRWRIMRACGVPETYITGNASWYEKYLAFARILPDAPGNPVYHWTHLELQRFFGIKEPLDEAHAKDIWEQVNIQLRTRNFTPRSILTMSHVETLCTTDDPADSLEFHHQLRSLGFSTIIIPAWRPDNVLKIENPAYKTYINRLATASDVHIFGFPSLLCALKTRMDAFERAGCVASDHDINKVCSQICSEKEADLIFRKKMDGADLTEKEIDVFKTTLLSKLAHEYSYRGWVMELHIGCNRNVNMRGVREIGEASGFDSPGDMEIATPLGSFLNRLEEENSLPKMVLFCMNPKDNWILASLANTFQDASFPSKIQFGTAWWMQDHIPGMRAQLEVFATTGVLGHFIGMLSDSRSFLSYPRFEYFRRILCDMLGSLVESGQYPCDMKHLGCMIENICFNNAKTFFAKKSRDKGN